MRGYLIFGHETFTFLSARSMGVTSGVPRIGTRRILTFLAAFLGVFSSVTASWAAATTVSLTTAGTLDVDRTGNLTAQLAEGLPSSGFFDVYRGTFSASAINVPPTPITQAYDNTLTGTVIVDETPFSFDNTSLPTTSAALSNELVLEAEAFASSPSGEFFPALLQNAFYTHNTAGNITVASQTDLATEVPDIEPLSVFFTSGTYAIDIPLLTLVSTPVAAAVPEPGSLVLLASAFLGFGVLRKR